MHYLTLCIAGLTYTVFPPTDRSPSEKDVREVINSKCRDVKFQSNRSKPKAGDQASSKPGALQED